MNEELVVRLNDKEYTNWLKAGRCLYILKDALHPYTDEQMRAFHRALLRDNPRLREQCPRSCQSGDIKLSRACGLCLQWKSEILNHHRQPGSTLNWDNCSPPAWRTNHWELAKAYMPRGQAHVNAAHQCDPSALLNLINFCDCFGSVDVHSSHVRELIRCRNDLMHSPDLHVKEAWMKKFKVVLRRFVQLFSQVPSMALAEPRLAQMLAVDLSICAMDTVDYTGMALAADSLVYHSGLRPESISQWETDLLQERLRELRHLAEDETVDTEQLMMLDGFLQENKDLGQRFSGELQAISTLGTGQKKS
ncbi:uncharacterized protein CXorf38 homolog [Hippocampus comes]|uniref:uncharacterized protein CXorf38 homolog n=1 Tax=Hippocampus comes TaxID=109280 RepID=UPI00094E9168|nr:PREDICTED: uncharacterized protein CXorf38 homolog [Hippocampus comes]